MKRIALTGAVALSVLASAACSSGTTTSTTQGGAAVSSSQAPSKPLSAYLLQQSDVPSGYQQQQLPPGAADAVGSITAATKWPAPRSIPTRTSAC